MSSTRDGDRPQRPPSPPRTSSSRPGPASRQASARTIAHADRPTERGARLRHPTSRDPQPTGRARVAVTERPAAPDYVERDVTGSATFAPARSWFLVLVVAALSMFGMVMVLSASSIVSLQETRSTWSFFGRQAIGWGLGALAFIVMASIDHRVIRKLSTLGLCVALGLNIAVIAVGQEINNARAWLQIGPLQLQPSELLKLALIVFVADLATRRDKFLHRRQAVLHPALAVLAVSVVLVLLQNDLGAAIVLAGCVMGVLFIAGVPLIPIIGVAGIGAVVGALAVVLQPRRMRRILSYLDPEAHASDAGFQNLQGRLGFGSGGVFGVGLGESRVKWPGSLPYAHTDFIFAIIGEELGLVGVSVVIGLFIVFGALGLRAAARCPDRFGQLLAGGITAWILVQAIINLGAVAGLLPVTGLTLPFFSFGGSSLLITMAAAGVLVGIARRGTP
jgi:cell division protein FtsW